MQIILPTSKKFALERKEDVNETILWSNFETIIVYEVLSYASINKDEKSLHKTYYDSATFTTFYLPKNVIQRKNNRQIHAKLRHIGYLK